jgi:hypothetical protein
MLTVGNDALHFRLTFSLNIITDWTYGFCLDIRRTSNFSAALANILLLQWADRNCDIATLLFFVI